MNAAHLHLILNHTPVVGAFLMLPLLLWAVYKRSVELLRVAFAAFVVVAVAALVVYLTGEPAEEFVEDLQGVDMMNIEAHEEAALISLCLGEALGILGMYGLWRLRAAAALPSSLTMGAVAAAVIVALSMAWTANLGGLIRHPEAAIGFVAPEH
jgi:hypothetical protein